jgi:hypothetical protein
VTKINKTALDALTGGGVLDMFEPMRRVGLMQENVDRILGYDTIRNLDLSGSKSAVLRAAAGLDSKSAALAAAGALAKPGVLDMIEGSVAHQLGAGLHPAAIDDVYKKLSVAAGLAGTVGAADRYGSLRLTETLDQITGMRESLLIGSSVLGPNYLESFVGASNVMPSLDKLLGNAYFEPGRMLEGFSAVDTSALMLGREATLAAIAGSALDWELSAPYALGDLVAPVAHEGDAQLVAAAFPPDLVADDPLTSEFEVDAIVAENQTGAQIFLALRSTAAARRMESARDRLREGDTEALAQSLTSCRRALHALADFVYPARPGKVRDRRGKDRVVDNEAFKNRLLMFLTEAIDSSKARALAEATVDQAVAHVDAVLGELNKGTHADILRDEATEAYVQTWAVIARVARTYSDR